MGRGGVGGADCGRGRALLFDVLLVPNVSDKWVWLPHIADGYIVRGAYDLLLNGDTSQIDKSLELV